MIERKYLRMLSAATAIAVTACAVKEEPATAAGDSAAPAAAAATPTANVVTITASEYKFDAPDQIPAG
ncbi:MAG TPA: hypothetical protein VM939_12645, partial [Gemmatimonadaceae bacterium]|nr:hypothetical protein [Gemmatimonadaceae bacterium]